MNNTMRAVVAEDYGTADQLVIATLPIPQPGPGQLQVRVAAAGLNPADLRLLDGVLRDRFPLTFPHVPGSEFAGTVTALGPDVTRFAVGDEVFGFGFPETAAATAASVASPASLTTGLLAEYAVITADTPGVQRRPAALPADQAGVLPLIGLTAQAVLRAADFGPGRTALVIGASGGTGSAVVPLLAHAGAHVLATARAEETAQLKAIGAADTIDYQHEDVVAETLRRHPDGVDVLVNLVLGPDDLVAASKAVRTGGDLITIAYPSPPAGTFDHADLTVRTVYTQADPDALTTLADLAVAGTLPVTVSRRYPLSQGAQALRDLITQHTRGKLVVLP